MTKELPSKFEQLNNELRSKVEGLERERDQAAAEYIPKMYYVLKEAGYSIPDARVTVEEHVGKYLSYWSIIKNIPQEAKVESKVIGGKATAEAREKRRLDQKSIQTHPIVLEEEVVKRILQMYVVENVRRMEIEVVAPGDVRIRALETITNARSN
jgi:malate synthase